MCAYTYAVAIEKNLNRKHNSLQALNSDKFIIFYDRLVRTLHCQLCYYQNTITLTL